MSAVELLVKILLAVAVVAFVGYPLLREQMAGEEELELPEEDEELYRRKETTYSALKELEFDYKTGKLSEQDFHELDARFKSSAVEILKAIDELENPTPKTKAARRAEREQAGEESNRRVSAGLPADTCGSCGNVNPSGARFCAVCGDPLAVVPSSPKSARKPADSAALCVSCGATLAVDHKFCGACGAEANA